jgi:hypothetical protein
VAVQLSFVEHGTTASASTWGRTVRVGALVFLDSLVLLPSISFLLTCRPAGIFYLLFIPFSSIDASNRKAVVSSLEQALHFSPSTFLSPPHCNSSLFCPTHLTMRHRISHLWLFLAFACTLLVGLVSAAPAPFDSSSAETLYRRQENGNPVTQPVVTQTVQTINTFVLSL